MDSTGVLVAEQFRVIPEDCLLRAFSAGLRWAGRGTEDISWIPENLVYKEKDGRLEDIVNRLGLILIPVGVTWRVLNRRPGIVIYKTIRPHPVAGGETAEGGHAVFMSDLHILLDKKIEPYLVIVGFDGPYDWRVSEGNNGQVN